MSDLDHILFESRGIILGSEVVRMCLAIPGKVVEAEEVGGLRVGRVRFGGIVRAVRLDFVPEARIGDYVMVHVGFAISQVDEQEAQRTYDLLREMGALEDELSPVDDSPAEKRLQ